MRERVGPAGLAVRDAVRRELADLAPADPEGAARPSSSPAAGRPLVLVACSGGPDSLALAAGTAFVAPRLGLSAGAVVVDHGLQPGSAGVAAAAAAQCRELGLDPVEVIAVTVEHELGEGPEAAARTARYAALDLAADRLAAAAVLLGHTRADQAEAVLLGLLRGSGARSLAGMARRRDRYRRPLLDLPRATTLAACVELGLTPWLDPHNADPTYARSRSRSLLAELEDRVGSGVEVGLARSADLLRADTEALDAWADREYALSQQIGRDGPSTGVSVDRHAELDCEQLATLPAAVRTRVLRRAALAVGARAADLSSTHLAAVDALVTDWHGQGPVALPGPMSVTRACGRLIIARP
jgi:tRNA(Ile)-lysidine synthase